MVQIEGEKGGDATGSSNVCSKGPKVGADLACTKNLEEAWRDGVKKTLRCGDGDEVREVMEMGHKLYRAL